MAKTKSKYFRVAVEGATTDGRTISRDWIKQMAATYNRAKYGARIFAEHIRGVVPDGPFRALGDVLAVKTEEITDGELTGKFALLAQIEPSDAMVKLIKSGQKIYSSIEIDHDFAGSGTAYLTGLGVTDSPASLGTEVLTFAAEHPDASPFRTRKVRPENLFSAARETAIELEDAEANDTPESSESKVFAKLQDILDKFSGKTKPAPAPSTDDNAGVAELAGALRDGLGDLASQYNQVTQDLKTLRSTIDAHKQTVDTDLANFRQDLDTTPGPGTPRPPATGGNGSVLTDC